MNNMMINNNLMNCHLNNVVIHVEPSYKWLLMEQLDDYLNKYGDITIISGNPLSDKEKRYIQQNSILIEF